MLVFQVTLCMYSVSFFFCADSDGIIKGNETQIMGLIWTLIQHYQIGIGFSDEDGGKGSGKTGKQILMEWLQVRIIYSRLIYSVLQVHWQAKSANL